MFNCIHIEATSLSDAWFQSIYKIIEIGRDFRIDRGSFTGDKRLEFDWFSIQIKTPWVEPMLPQLPAHYNIPDPVVPEYINGYLPYLMTGEKQPGESYTYGQRICKHPISGSHKELYNEDDYKDILIQDKEVWEDSKIIIQEESTIQTSPHFLNQMELLIWTYKNKGYRNNQMIMQVATPSDMTLQDPPCLRHIDTRIQDGKLHFFPYFRSWDLWGGFSANLQAIEMMKQYVSSEIGVENGEIVASSKGLHIYKYAWELAEILRGKTIEEFREGK